MLFGSGMGFMTTGAPLNWNSGSYSKEPMKPSF